MKKYKILALALTFVAFQEVPAQVIFTSETRLIVVNISVKDKMGKPVLDLKKEDFTLYDKGQEQAIKYFSMETNKPMAEAMQPLPEGVVANREWTKSGSSGGRAATLPNAVTVILIDALNSRFQNQHAAREGLIKFLTQIQPGDQVALYTLGNGMRVLHDFTTDTASLLKSVAVRLFVTSALKLSNRRPTTASRCVARAI